MDCGLCIMPGLDDERLITGKWNPIWRFWVQDVFARHEQNLEASLFVGLNLSDPDAILAEDRQCCLIRLVGAFLSLLDDGTHRSEEHLSFDSTSPRRGA